MMPAATRASTSIVVVAPTPHIDERRVGVRVGVTRVMVEDQIRMRRGGQRLFLKGWYPQVRVRHTREFAHPQGARANRAGVQP